MPYFLHYATQCHLIKGRCQAELYGAMLLHRRCIFMLGFFQKQNYPTRVAINTAGNLLSNSISPPLQSYRWVAI